jgi:dipeptide transport system substrate-binding protein
MTQQKRKNQRTEFSKHVFCLISLTFFIASCQYQSKANVRDDVLVYCSEGSPETFNPQLSTSGVTFDASSRTLYNRLVEFEPGTTNTQPALATSWEVSENGKEYTFHLRKEVQFHQTSFFSASRNFNADDVLFSFQKQWFKSHPYYIAPDSDNSLRYHYFESMRLNDIIQNLVKIDEFTIKFQLTRPESQFLATLAMDFASILSAEYAKNLLESNKIDDLNKKPIGTGPFQLVRYQPDAFIRYKAHKLYWKGEQQFSNLVFAITPDPSLRFARIVAGECDVMANPLPIHTVSTNQFKNIEIMSDAGLNVAFLSLNTQKAPFNNQNVRLALNYAINKPGIIKAVYQSTATPAITPLPPTMWAFDKSIVDYEYNPSKAKELLRQAGYKNGFELKIWTTSAQRPYNPNAKKMAELIQQNLNQIDIKTKITTFEFATLLNKVRAGEHQAALMGWTGDNGDPDNFLTPLLSCASTITGTNSAFWCDPWFNQLIYQARSQTKIKTRQRLYFRAQQIFKQASPWVPIAHATQHLIYNSRVKNLKISPSGGINFNGVYLQEAAGELNE